MINLPANAKRTANDMTPQYIICFSSFFSADFGSFQQLLSYRKGEKYISLKPAYSHRRPDLPVTKDYTVDNEVSRHLVL